MSAAVPVAGIVGFDKDFGTTASFTDEGTDELFEIMKKGTYPISHVSQMPVATPCSGQRMQSCAATVLLIVDAEMLDVRPPVVLCMGVALRQGGNGAARVHPGGEMSCASGA